MNDTPQLIAALREQIGSVSPAELPGIIGQLEAVKAEAFAKLVTPLPVPEPAPPPAEEDVPLTVDQVAVMIQESPRWVRDHRKDLPVMSWPGRSLRFSSRRMKVFMKRKGYA